MKSCRNIKFLGLLLVLQASACSVATSPDRIGPTYVAPDNFQEFDCPALARKLALLGYRIEDLYSRLQLRHSRDQWQLAFSWFYGFTGAFVDGDGAEAEQFRQLQGNFEAARIQAVRKDCGFEAPTRREIVIRARASLEASEMQPPDSGSR